jgi:hypothetical protein
MSYNNIVGVRVEQAQVVGVTTSGTQDCPLSPGSTGTLGGAAQRTVGINNNTVQQVDEMVMRRYMLTAILPITQDN